MNTRRHGSPYDRGAADSYYQRGPAPHYYTGDTYNSLRVEEADMTPEEIQEYMEGFAENERQQNYKEWD